MFLLCCCLFIGNVYAQQNNTTLSYDTYQEFRHRIAERFDQEQVPLTSAICQHTIVNGELYISPQCILDDNIPPLSMTESVNLLWDHIDAFSTFYDLQRQYFEYDTAQPILSQDIQQYATMYDHTLSNRYVLQ